MAQALPSLGGNVYPGVQIVMTRTKKNHPDEVNQPFQTILDPPITIPAGSNISVQGSLQIDNTPTISRGGFNLKITVQPKLADVAHNKRHVDPVRPQWFPTDQELPMGCPRYAYNAANGLVTGVPSYNRSQHFGTIIPGGDPLKTLQIPPDTMNTISAISDSHCYMYPFITISEAFPSKDIHVCEYDTAVSRFGILCSRKQYEGYTSDIAENGYLPYGPYVTSYVTFLDRNQRPYINQSLISDTAMPTFSATPCLSQSVYIPYPTAVSVNAVSPFYTMAQTTSFNAASNSGNAMTQFLWENAPGTSGSGAYCQTQSGIDFWSRASMSSTWQLYESGTYSAVSGNATAGSSWDISNFMYRGLPQINAGNIMFNAHIVPNTKWIYKPLKTFVPTYDHYVDRPDNAYIPCAVYSYADVLSSSPYPQVLQACSVVKASTTGQLQTMGSGLPGVGKVFTAPKIDAKVTPIVNSCARNTTMLNAPLFHESYVTQIGCVLPWNWSLDNLFDDKSNPFHFRITNGIETFNELTDPPMSRQTALNLNRFIQELTQCANKGTVGALIPTGETFSPPPPQLAPFARLFINQPGSFYSPFVTQNQELIRQLHPSQPSDLTGNFYDNRTVHSGTYSQDKTGIANGPFLQNTWRASPYGGFADFSVPLEFVSRPTSFLRLPAVHCPKPVTDVLFGKGRSVPRITDPTMPPPKPYGYQTFWTTIGTGGTLLYENNIPALDLSRAALEAMGTRADFYLLNAIKLTWDTQNNQTGGGNSMYVLPFTWWGYTVTKFTMDELYSSGNFSSNSTWAARTPFLTQTVIGSGQCGFVSNGNQQLNYNSTTTPWGVNPAFPVVGINDLVAIPVTSGTPGYASCEPLLGWIYPNSPNAPTISELAAAPSGNLWGPDRIRATENVALNFQNIGFTVSGGLTALTARGYESTLQEPTAGCYTVAGRSIVQSGWAYPFKYNHASGSYCDPFTVTATINIPPGRYSYTALANVINVALNDPECSYSSLSCNIHDDDGNETPIPGCINNIGYDPAYHNLLWTNASGKDISMKNLPKRLTPQTLYSAMKKCSSGPLSFTLNQLQQMFPPEFYDSSLPDSRVVTAFRAADDVALLSNLTLNYSQTGNFFLSGAVASYEPPGGSSQGYAVPSPPVASFAGGWYTRCPSDPQAIGLVSGASLKNPNNSASFDSDPVFIAYGYPYFTDVTLNDGNAGPINPLRNFTGGFAFSDLTRSSFTNIELTQNYAGMSTTMKGTMEPCAMNGATNWIGASSATLRVLGPFIFCAKFNGPSEYLHKSPIINPTRALAFQGLSGVSILKISGVSPSDTQYIHDFFGFQQGEYSQQGTLSHVAFSEGEAYLYDTETNHASWVYNPNHFCYLSPHETDSPMFTARLFEGLDAYKVAESSFGPPGDSLRPEFWPFSTPTPTPFQARTPDDGYGTGGYAPFPTVDRYYSLGSLCEVVFKNAHQIQYGYVDNTEDYDASRPVPVSIPVVDTAANSNNGTAVASAMLSNDLNWEHSVLFHIHQMLGYPFVFDLPPLPAAHGMMSFLSAYESEAARTYIPHALDVRGDSPHTSFAPGPYVSTVTGLPNSTVWPFSAAPQNCYIGPFSPTSNIKGNLSDWRMKHDDIMSTWVPDYLHMQSTMTKSELDDFSQFNSGTAGAYPVYNNGGSPQTPPGTWPISDPAGTIFTARATFQVRNNAMGQLYKTSNMINVPTGEGRYIGGPVTILSPVTGNFLYRNSWPPVPSAAKPAYLFPSIAYTNPSTKNYGNAQVGFHQSLVMAAQWPDPANFVRVNGYLSGLSFAVNLSCNTNGFSTNYATPVPSLAGNASNSNIAAFGALYWDPIIPGTSIDNVTLRLRSWYPDLSTYSRAHLGRLEQTVNQGPNPDGFLHWYLNPWQAPGAPSSAAPPGIVVFPGSALPPSSCLYGVTHSAFTHHAYRFQNFGPLQSLIVPAIRERECMEPLLRASLGAQGFSRYFSVSSPAVPSRILWVSDPNSSVQIQGSNPTSWHYAPQGPEAPPALGNSVSSYTHRVLAPLSYIAKDMHSMSSLTPNYIRRFNPANNLYYYDTLRYDYSLLETFRACLPPALDQALYPIIGGFYQAKYMNLFSTAADGNTYAAQATYCPPFTLGPKAFYDQHTDYSAVSANKAFNPNSWFMNNISNSIQSTQQLMQWAFSGDDRTLVNAIGFLDLKSEVAMYQRISTIPAVGPLVNAPLTASVDDANQIFVWRPPISLSDLNQTFRAGLNPTSTQVCGPALPISQALFLDNTDVLENQTLANDLQSCMFTGGLGADTYNAGPLVRTPAPVRLSWLYPSNSTAPSTTYMAQTHTWNSQTGAHGDTIMRFIDFKWHSSARNGFCYAKTPSILNVIGRMGFNSSTYSSLGCFGPPSTDILIALGYQIPKYGPSHRGANDEWFDAPEAVSPPYIPLANITGEQIWKKIIYEHRHQIARRFAFYNAPPQDLMVFPIPINSTKVNPYYSDSYYSGPTINYNDSAPSDVNPILFGSPAFTTWDLAPAAAQQFGAVYLVKMDCVPSVLSHRCDIRVNMGQTADSSINKRFLDHEVLIPTPQPTEQSEVSDYTYEFTCPPPMEDCQLSSLKLSISNLDSEEVMNVFSHSISINISPSVNPPQLSGYGTVNGEISNANVPRLAYQRL